MLSWYEARDRRLHPRFTEQNACYERLGPCNGQGLSIVQQRLIGIDGESFTHAKHALPKGIFHEIFPDNNRLEEPESRTH
jgi:hypothetical protein